MKHYFFKKCLAAFMAGAVLSIGVSTTMPVSITAATTDTNLISNGTFDRNTTGWAIYTESGGSAALGREDAQLALNVTSVGTLSYAVQLYYDIIPLYENGVYHLSYEISSTTDRYVEAMIQQNGGTYQAYTWKGLNLTSETQTVDYTFTMTAETDIMAKLVFNCGYENEELTEHTIYLDNVTLELVDDSEVDYTADAVYEPSIVVNQVGYYPDSEKIAVFRDITTETEFSVINADTEEVVYTDALYGETVNTSADETDYYGDFSAITETGTYYITCGELDNSYSFEIRDDVYDGLLDDTVRMLYLQRCGTEIEDDTFGHEACHTTEATIYGTDETIDVSGGWHDAGDYGRYVVPAAKTIADLLYAYAANPTLYSDNSGIPESGNGIPDVLDEVRYGLEWMLKMQADSGGVYHKVTCENFPGYVMPEEETDELIVTPVSTTATADFCAVMAMAYEFYDEIDSDFAETCLMAAENAWSFLEENPSLIFDNPEDITTGEYGDTSDKDERYWAVAQLYRATGEDTYLTELEGMTARTGLDWSTVGDYGNIAILTMDEIDTTSTAYTKAETALLNQADKYVTTTENSAYGIAISSFNWGSNMTIANAGVILGLAYQLTGTEAYLTCAQSNLNYLLGENPNGVCYVTGYGTVSPENPHHRPSMAQEQAMPGMLVGGVNSNLEDSAAVAYLSDTPAAKCYVDNSESYSTNEVTTYWNSSLIYLLSLTNVTVEEATIGDVDADGAFALADILMMQQYLLANGSLTDWENGDLNEDGLINGMDLTLMRRLLLDLSDFD